MKLLITAVLVFTITGCANQAAQDYYLASQQVAVQASQAYQARMIALTEVAKSNPDQSGAVAMAIALSDAPQHGVQYVEDPALKWASVLAGPAAAVAGVYINSNQAVDLAEINAKTQLARIDADADTQQAAYSAINQGGVGALGIASEMVGLVNDTVNTSLATVGSTVNTSMATVGSTVDSSYAFSGDVASEAFATVNQTVGASYDFSLGALTQGYDFSSFLVETYDPYIVQPAVFTPVIEITPVVEITPIANPGS